MGYRWIEHTGEMELEIEAPTREEVFSEATHALGELIGDGPRGDTVAREIALTERDLAALLARWLDELVFLAEAEDLVPEAVDRIELGDGLFGATVRCHRGHPRHLVKGATYHRLVFEPSGRRYHATVVLDV